MVEIFMPKMGMDMLEGTLIRWIKEIGDPIEKDEPLIEIETDKVTMEVESPGVGYLLAKLVDEGSVVPVLQTIGYIGEKGEEIPELSEKNVVEEKGGDTDTNDALLSDQVKPLEADGLRCAATPYARRLAREKGVELSQIKASGPKGEVVARDITAAATATPLTRWIVEDKGISMQGIVGSGHSGKIRKEDLLSTGASANSDEKIQLSNQRKVIARRMLQSHTEIPVVTQHMKVYTDNLMELRKKMNAINDEKTTVNDLIIKIVALAVKEYPIFRSKLDGDSLIITPEVNIGFAVGMDDGLLVPVIHNADLMPLNAISSKAKELITKARNGSLKREEMTGGCFTITNLGMYDMFAFTPIINQPEVGILGVNSVNEELFLDGGALKSRGYMMISLTFDHRAMDGVYASKFQLRIKELIENPIKIII